MGRGDGTPYGASVDELPILFGVRMHALQADRRARNIVSQGDVTVEAVLPQHERGDLRAPALKLFKASSAIVLDDQAGFG